MPQRILVILGHPSTASDRLCTALATAYVEGARTAGAQVRELRLSELRFDPVLHEGCRIGQPLEPDLQAAQAHITWAGHLVWVYPTWWGAMPALLKGFIDRVFVPGFSHRYRNDSPLWDRLLAGRSAELIVTMDSPRWYYRWVQRMPGHQQMRRSILEFSGIRPVRIHGFGPVVRSSAAQRARWVEQARALGARRY